MKPKTELFKKLSDAEIDEMMKVLRAEGEREELMAKMPFEELMEKKVPDYEILRITDENGCLMYGWGYCETCQKEQFLSNGYTEVAPGEYVCVIDFCCVCNNDPSEKGEMRYCENCKKMVRVKLCDACKTHI